jgi:D-alanine transaminase
MRTDRLTDLPCFLNGEFTHLREAKVSVMDRGFIFGDGIYEVVPLYGGRPFRFDQHMQRLDRSLREIRIPNPQTPEGWRALVDELVRRHAAFTGEPASAADQLVYLQVTRGVAMREHTMVEGLEPTVFAMANKMAPVSAQDRARGLECVTADDFRWQRSHIKSVSLLGAVMARQISADQGAAETVMFRDGFLSEGAAVNVWVARDGKLFGPPRDNLVLEGIRYGLIESLCREAGIPFELRRIARDEVLTADELLLSSATKEVVAVTKLDGTTVGNGRPGPIYEKLYALYQRAKQAS